MFALCGVSELVSKFYAAWNERYNHLFCLYKEVTTTTKIHSCWLYCWNHLWVITNLEPCAYWAVSEEQRQHTGV